MLQFVGLERTTKSGGRDRIDHPHGCHDDVANAAAGALVYAYAGSGYSPQQEVQRQSENRGALQALGEVSRMIKEKP
jgi:hypothetical protein